MNPGRLSHRRLVEMDLPEFAGFKKHYRSPSRTQTCHGNMRKAGLGLKFMRTVYLSRYPCPTRNALESCSIKEVNRLKAEMVLVGKMAHRADSNVVVFTGIVVLRPPQHAPGGRYVGDGKNPRLCHIALQRRAKRTIIDSRSLQKLRSVGATEKR